MHDRFITIVLMSLAVGGVYVGSILTTPDYGIMKLLVRAAEGTAICFFLYLLLSPFGIFVPVTPFSALFSGLLGFPGLAFSAFLTMWP